MYKSQTVSLLAFAFIFAVAGVPVAEAGGVLGILKDIIPSGVAKCSVDVWNHTEQPVTVVMDNEREVRDIAPHSKATFSPNFGDMPTFHFNQIGTRVEIGAKKVGSPGNSTVEWLG